jgi:hypothetical protein
MAVCEKCLSVKGSFETSELRDPFQSAGAHVWVIYPAGRSGLDLTWSPVGSARVNAQGAGRSLALFLTDEFGRSPVHGRTEFAAMWWRHSVVGIVCRLRHSSIRRRGRETVKRLSYCPWSRRSQKQLSRENRWGENASENSTKLLGVSRRGDRIAAVLSLGRLQARSTWETSERTQ